ncbi:transferase hexapeptide repeat protein [Bordetella bronchiseptica SBL-F6116]|uniref:acyltransferase n=1 Tax=Bordetella bronchiseptica TaxID=518 RepID=UPI0004599089|nr:acyltransferase [Bordetella bronchiseptica]KCV35936.1 transferase hexapeptide repeat protein [Bordetella bronchiseptica 00-P-2730]KDD99174.1 transferase hexapeptide repeat protein [Bordetella bronchiseptica SBL-F6116]
MAIPMIKMAIIGSLPSRLKVAYYRMKGASIGKNVKIGLFSVILADEITIGDDTRIGALSFIRCRKLHLGNRVQIGSMVAVDTGEVKIGHDSSIMEQVVIGGMKTPRSRIDIGARVKVFPYCFLNPTEPIVIENEVGVGGSNYLFTHGSWQSVLDGYPIGFGPITIRKGVWLPWRVFILPNVEIGEYCTIGAGAIINKNIPPRSLAVGAPAKVISENGAYLKAVTREGKQDIVRNILAEFAEFLTYEGKPSTVHSDEHSVVITVENTGSRPQVVRFALNAEDVENTARDATAILSFDTIPDGVRAELGSRNMTWFDLESTECTFGTSPLFHDIRNYFSRFGVRFAISGESDI